MSRFTNSFDYQLGTLEQGQPTERETFLREGQFENDIYEFDITGTQNLNLSLNSLEAEDDADLYLYEDTNHNGILDSGDLDVAISLRSDNHDDAINYRAEAGTYFARVNYYESEGDDRLEYDLDLAADITGTGSSTIAVEKDFGTSLIGEEAALETGYISDYNTSDTYAVSVVHGEVIDITLAGLSNDADLRVIQDTNQNNIVDADEIYAESRYGGTHSDSISLSESGDYLVEVYQYTGATDYTLQFDQEFV